MSNMESGDFEPTKDDLQHLREWLEKTPYIIQDYDDNFLSNFIKGCKGSLTKTKTALENLNSLGMKYPDMFENLDPFQRKLQEYLNTKRGYILPKKTENGSLIYISSLNFNLNNEKSTHSLETYRYMLLTIYVIIWENLSPNGKIIAITDCKDVTAYNYTSVLTLPVLKKIQFFAQKCLPIRVQKSYYVNFPTLAETVIKILKAMLPKKFAERINCYSTAEILIQNFSKDLLPKEYGGTLDSIDVLHEQWREKVEGYRDRFIKEQIKMRSLDPIRPVSEEEKIIESFRKLDVD